MNAPSAPSSRDDAREARDLPPGARTVGLVACCSFLTAAAATAVTFAFVDPAALPQDALTPWARSHWAVYAVGFFFLWTICAVASALTIYMAHTERRTPGP
jgi:hypothetical protein